MSPFGVIMFQWINQSTLILFVFFLTFSTIDGCFDYTVLYSFNSICWCSLWIYMIMLIILMTDSWIIYYNSNVVHSAILYHRIVKSNHAELFPKKIIFHLCCKCRYRRKKVFKIEKVFYNYDSFSTSPIFGCASQTTFSLQKMLLPTFTFHWSCWERSNCQ